MKLIRTIWMLTLAALLVSTCAAQGKQSPDHPNGAGAAPSAGPMLVIDSLTHDFGEVKAGTPLKYAFKIKNQGKADLLINSVSPG